MLLYLYNLLKNMVAKFSSIILISVIAMCVVLAMVECSDASDEQDDVRVLGNIMKRWP